MLDPTSSFLDLSSRFSQSPLTLVIWFEHAQIICKEAWPWSNREHVLFSRACSVSQTGQTDRQTDELPPNDQMWGSLMLAPNYWCKQSWHLCYHWDNNFHLHYFNMLITFYAPCSASMFCCLETVQSVVSLTKPSALSMVVTGYRHLKWWTLNLFSA